MLCSNIVTNKSLNSSTISGHTPKRLPLLVSRSSKWMSLKAKRSLLTCIRPAAGSSPGGSGSLIDPSEEREGPSADLSVIFSRLKKVSMDWFVIIGYVVDGEAYLRFPRSGSHKTLLADFLEHEVVFLDHSWPCHIGQITTMCRTQGGGLQESLL